MKRTKILLALAAFVATVGIVGNVLAQEVTDGDVASTSSDIIPVMTEGLVKVVEFATSTLDINHDGIIDSVDVNLVQRCVAASESCGKENVDGKGAINNFDVLLVKGHLGPVGEHVFNSADVDRDGDVDLTDIGLVKACLGKKATDNCEQEDANAHERDDNQINAFDILFVRGHLGNLSDVNRDGNVDTNDTKLVTACIGKSSDCKDEDVTGDGKVNAFDVLRVRGGFPAPATTTSSESPANPPVTHHLNSGSIARLAPASGSVLGASVVNWNALSATERLGMVASFRQQLAGIVRLFGEWKSQL